MGMGIQGLLGAKVRYGSLISAFEEQNPWNLLAAREGRSPCKLPFRGREYRLSASASFGTKSRLEQSDSVWIDFHRTMVGFVMHQTVQSITIC